VWRDIFVPPGAPMTEQLDQALGEATMSVVLSSVKWSAATPEGEGHLDDMVQLFNNEGP
jgi:hypothetical protein